MDINIEVGGCGRRECVAALGILFATETRLPILVTLAFHQVDLQNLFDVVEFVLMLVGIEVPIHVSGVHAIRQRPQETVVLVIDSYL